MKSKPVVPPPAEHAANWPQRKHTEQSVEGTQLGLFEFYRVAAGTFMPYPEQMR
jgi:hypothetical protein